MKRILIVGAFGFKEMLTGGQPVKTRELYYLLSREYGEENVEFIETKGWKKNPIKLIFSLYQKVKKCGIIIMLPAQNGVAIFGRIFSFIKKISGKKVFYDVIGGWLPEKLQKEKSLIKSLKIFDGIWVETASMQTNLNELGLNNVSVIPNFKNLTTIKADQLSFQVEPPFNLCTFSRVMKEKGIEDAINAVKIINQKYDKTLYRLDIYGHIDEEYIETFNKLRQSFPDYISYEGCVSPSESVEVLKDYFLLLFPTYYHGEGLAGTLIDALSSGTPVIATKWHYNADVINSKNGFLIPVDNRSDSIVAILEQIYLDTTIVNSKKIVCLEDAKKYTPEYAFKILNKSILG